MQRKKQKQVRYRAEYIGKPDPRVDYVIVDLVRDALASLKSFASTTFTYSNNEKEAAVQHWFSYLAALISMTTDSVAMLALNRQSLSALCMQRQVVEYAAKALYFDEHEDEAWYQFHHAAKEKLSILRDLGKEGTDEYLEAETELAEAIRLCPPVALSKRERRPVGIAEIMQFHGQGKRDVYAKLFRVPSLVLHAHPLGMGQVYAESSTPGVREVRFQMPVRDIDALFIDLAFYLISFGTAYDKRVTESRFQPQWNNLWERLMHMQKRFDERYGIIAE